MESTSNLLNKQTCPRSDDLPVLVCPRRAKRCSVSSSSNRRGFSPLLSSSWLWQHFKIEPFGLLNHVETSKTVSNYCIETTRILCVQLRVMLSVTGYSSKSTKILCCFYTAVGDVTICTYLSVLTFLFSSRSQKEEHKALSG